MKRVVAIAIVTILIFGGITFSNAEEYTKKIKVQFFEPKFTQKENYIRIEMPNENGEELYIMAPGKPMLPRVLKIFELPFGVRNVKVEVEVKEVEEKIIEKQIMPAPAPMPLTPIKGYHPPGKDEEVYSSNKLYPSGWYSYRVGCGLNEKMEHVTFVTVNIYPVRYLPAENKVVVAKNAEIKISYLPPKKPWIQRDVYDMVIIAPSEFSDALQKLVEHKNNYGVKTFLMTTEEIYSKYNGRDEPEKIKYFIKNAIEQYGIKYVLLVGGLKSLIYAKPKDN
ncbi:MAG: peptidase C25, partial [Thermoplasmata archaeon]